MRNVKLYVSGARARYSECANANYTARRRNAYKRCRFFASCCVEYIINVFGSCTTRLNPPDNNMTWYTQLTATYRLVCWNGTHATPEKYDRHCYVMGERGDHS